MTDPARLPALLRLLDDESPVVRAAVSDALAAMGNALGPALAGLGYRADSAEAVQVREILAPHTRAWLRGAWTAWFTLPRDVERLEGALSLLAEYQSGRLHPARLGSLLDGLADAYRATHPTAGARSLAEFLFRARGLRGAHDDYYDPRNSNLIDVIERGKGIPLSLAAIYMLVGDRVGILVEGTNYPAHFLARVTVDGEPYLVDCFDGGRFFRPEALLGTHPRTDHKLRRTLETAATPERMIGRVLNNLVRAYQGKDQVEDCALMEDLRRTLEEWVTGPREETGPRSRP